MIAILREAGAKRALVTSCGDAGQQRLHAGGDVGIWVNDESVVTYLKENLKQRRKGKVDPGRHGGIQKLKQSRFNLLGPYNDDPLRRSATGTRYVTAQHRNFGEFRVPSLRHGARTAPYMHNGRLATLRDVVRRYSEIDLDRLHSDGERLLRPLHLGEREIDDLVAFLETLTEGPTRADRESRLISLASDINRQEELFRSRLAAHGRRTR